MNIKHKAVIFDMDGVIIDSERLWKQAEKEIFSSLGVMVTDEYSEITKSMTTSDVTGFWFDKFPWQNVSLDNAEQMVISRVTQLIDTENCEINGVKEFIENLKARNYKIGMATNSPNSIIPTVLNKIDALHLFDTISSAEFEANGKPDPAIYLTTAKKLSVNAINCVAIEDSYSGMLAAKKAGMKVVAFTNGNTEINFDIADYKIDWFKDFDINQLN
ncbi:hexitol phosphatase HxpB [Flavihumibacter cheonanensis]|uniref:hexitol phosphatase HxpB n=1 Tax=Flavihumibacter cheonanensis TaxID=1442385 RepID=UPI001EF81F0A|nr:hexitol phosphatase HxpB [Flavihumibacter cheonanensis]MCG7754810.1 hexitol phosphatase HxpB [Flavihumibacter cheonanensis]